jgi:aromatic ring-cleaving dioxygenase
MSLWGMVTRSVLIGMIFTAFPIAIIPALLLGGFWGAFLGGLLGSLLSWLFVVSCLDMRGVSLTYRVAWIVVGITGLLVGAFAAGVLSSTLGAYVSAIVAAGLSGVASGFVQWFSRFPTVSAPLTIGAESQTIWRPLSNGELARRRKKKTASTKVSVELSTEQKVDSVDCTVFAPASITGGDVVFVQVFVHLPKQARAAKKMAEAFDEETRIRGYNNLEAFVARGSKLMFDLSIPGLRTGELVQWLTWNGRAASVQFAVGAPSKCPQHTAVGTVTISLGSVPIGHVKFKLSICDAKSVHPLRQSEPVGDDAKVYTVAFISYASEDRDKVLPRVQMLTALGISFFQDVLNLDPGERWEKAIYVHIDKCDLFLLFWSSAAAQSVWVRKEAQYALARKGGNDYSPPEIRPVIIEGPPIIPPWPELAHMHFNDRILYLLAANSK